MSEIDASQDRHPSGSKADQTLGLYACHRCDTSHKFKASDIRYGWDADLDRLGYVVNCPNCGAENDVPEEALTDQVKAAARPVDPA